MNKPLNLVRPNTIDVQRHELVTKLKGERECVLECSEGNGEDTLLNPDKRQVSAILKDCNGVVVLVGVNIFFFLKFSHPY